MSASQKHDWSLMAWPEILEQIDAGADAVILPVGATEQHGPHLGVGMDFLLADVLAAEVARRTAVPVLPTLPYSCSIGHSHRWPGTLALSPTTLIAVLGDIGDWLYGAGIRRLFIMNCHVGNRSPIGCALDILRCRYDDLLLASFDVGALSPEMEAVFTRDGADWHANAAETSLMLHLAPHAVRPDQIAGADDPDRTGTCVFRHPVNRTSSNGVTGRPSEASAVEGAALFERLADFLSGSIERGLEECPPLGASYFRRIEKTETL